MDNRIILLVILGILAACQSENEISSNATGVEMLTSPAAEGSAEAHLALTLDGSVVLSWQEPEGAGHALKYSMLTDSQWQTARTVARGESWFINSVDFPSVVPISQNLWAAHWLEKRPGGTYVYDVAISLSDDAGRTWSRPISPHTDGTATEHGFVSLYPAGNGVGAVWLDGRNMIEDKRRTMTEDDPHLAESSDHVIQGMTLRSATITPDLELENSQQVDELTCSCCQTDVAMAPDGPIAIYRDRDANEIRDMSVARSVGGQWQDPIRVSDDGWKIAGCPANGPAIVANDAIVAAAWFTAPDNRPFVRMAYSSDSGLNFSQPVNIDEEKPIGRVDIALLHNNDAVVSWLRRNELGQTEISARMVSQSGHVGNKITIAQSTVSQASGLPQMVLHGNDLLFAWTGVSEGKTQVLTARVPVDVLRMQSDGTQ